MDKNALRNDIIKYGISHGHGVDKINKVLDNAKLPSYNPLTHLPNYVAIPGRLWEQGREFGTDLATFGGNLIRPAATIIDKASKGKSAKDKLDILKNETKKLVTDKEFQKTAGGAVVGAGAGLVLGRGAGAVPGALAGGMIGSQGLRGTADLMLQPYNVSTGKIVNSAMDIAKALGVDKQLNKKLKDIGFKQNTNERVNLLDIIQGMQYNPLYTTLDTSPLTGKAIKYAVNKIPSNASKISTKQLFPDANQRKFNRDMTEALQSSRAKSSELYKSAVILDNLPSIDRAEVVNFLRAGKGNLAPKELKLAKSLRSDLIKNQNELIKFGNVKPKDMANDIIAQYVMHNIAEKSNLIHKDIKDIMDGKNNTRAKRLLKEEGIADEISKLIKEGKKLQKDNKIVFLSQKLAPSKDPLGKISATALNAGAKDYFDTSRIIGRTDAKRLGKVLDDTLEFQLNQVGYGREGADIMGKLLENDVVSSGMDSKVKANIIDKFNKSIAEDISKGELPDLNKAFSNSGVRGKIEDIYYEAVNNAFKKPKNHGLRRILNAFKKAVLGQPHWVILNRYGNISNNIMDGVSLVDYLDTNKYKHLAPKELKQQTQFASYIDEGIPGVEGTSISPLAFGGSINKIKRGWNKYFSKEKGERTLSDKARLGADLISSTSDLFANPWYKLEANLEFVDRYANFIRQAKREAAATGKSVEDILKEANKNKVLYNKLNTGVNKALGDYVGRNYFLPSGYYEMLGEGIPFYRFLTQTGRTTGHQLVNHPYNFQSMIGIPERYGKQLSNEIIQQYNLDPEMYEGGVPYRTVNGQLRLIGMEPLPIGSLLGVSKWDNFQNVLAPWLTTAHDIIDYKKFGKAPSSPRLNKILLTNPDDADKYKPTPSERAKYAFATAARTMYNPIIQTERYLVPISQQLLGLYNSNLNKPTQSFYDTELFKYNPMSFPKDLPSERIFNMFGVKSRTGYNKRAKSKSAIKREQYKANRNRAKLINNLERMKGK